MRPDLGVFSRYHKPSNPAKTFQDNLMNIERVKKMKEWDNAAPLRDNLLALKTNESQFMLDTQPLQQDMQRNIMSAQNEEAQLKSAFSSAALIAPYLQPGNVKIDSVRSKLQQQIMTGQQSGMDTSIQQEALAMTQTPEGVQQLAQMTGKILEYGQKMGFGQGNTSTPVKIQELEFMKGVLSPQDYEKAVKYYAGITSRAPSTVDVNGVEHILSHDETGKPVLMPISMPDGTPFTNEVNNELIKGETEVVEGVKTSEQQTRDQNKSNIAVEQEAKIAENQQKRDLAATRKEQRRQLGVYNSAIKSVAEARDYSGSTGSLVGLLPALTDGQRIIDGSVETLFNAIKPMFRGKGEGVFTDKDADIIKGMLPTRRDSPKVAEIKMRNLDDLIRATLEVDSQEGDNPKPVSTTQRPDPNAVLVEDANGNRAWKMPDGTYVEVK